MQYVPATFSYFAIRCSLWIATWVVCFFSFSLQSAFADSSFFDNRLYVSGFGSLGVAKHDRIHDGYEADILNTKLLGYDSSWGYEPVTLIGAQAHFDLNDDISFTGQVISKAFNPFDDVSEFEPEVRWLIGSYYWSKSSRIRLGRMRAPLTFFSDTYEVRFSYPWAQGPPSVYEDGMFQLSTIDGADYLAIFDVGPGEAEFQAFAGGNEQTFGGVDNELVIAGAALTYRWHSFTLRYAGAAIYQDLSGGYVDQIYDAYHSLSGMAPVFNDLAHAFHLKDMNWHFHNFGLRWDRNEWTVLSEAIFRRVDNDKSGGHRVRTGYLSVIYNDEHVSPYLTYSYWRWREYDPVNELIAMSEQVVPQGVSQELDFLRQASTAGRLSHFGWDAYTAGISIHIHPKAALKLDFTLFRDDARFESGVPLPPAYAKESYMSTVVLDVLF